MLLLKFDSKLVLKLDNRLSADNEISHNNLLNHLGWSWSDYFGGNFDGDFDLFVAVILCHALPQKGICLTMNIFQNALGNETNGPWDKA